MIVGWLPPILPELMVGWVVPGTTALGEVQKPHVSEHFLRMARGRLAHLPLRNFLRHLLNEIVSAQDAVADGLVPAKEVLSHVM